MDTIRHILKDKGTQVLSVGPNVTVVEAVKIMCDGRVGALMISDGDEPVGIFSERDLMTRVILAERDPHVTSLSDVMTSDVVCVDPDTTASEAMAVMTERRCRHLPVMEGSRLVGLVSIGDLVSSASRNQEFHIRMLTNYIHGTYPG